MGDIIGYAVVDGKVIPCSINDTYNLGDVGKLKLEVGTQEFHHEIYDVYPTKTLCIAHAIKQYREYIDTLEKLLDTPSGDLTFGKVTGELRDIKNIGGKDE
jgi:hypothetical protein